MTEKFLTGCFRFAKGMEEQLTRLALPLGLLLACGLSGALAAYNVTTGPLHNLNDIGSYRLRVLLTALTAAAHLLGLVILTLRNRKSFSRLALRQLLLTIFVYICELAVNQKTYFYTQSIQPILEAMRTGGLSAGLAAKSALSGPMLALLCLVAKCPIYDMYIVKLLCCCAMGLLALLTLFYMDEQGAGIRAETAFLLVLILPQGFMTAACTALVDLLPAALLVLSLGLYMGFAAGKKHPRLAMLAYGTACALSGVALYALPLIAWLICKKKLTGADALCGLAALCALCLPCMLCGMGLGGTLGSLLRANFAIQPYAAGTPGLLSLIPRAEVAEMPAAFLLDKLPAVSYAAGQEPYYMADNFEVLSRGMTGCGLMLFAGVCALSLRMQDDLRRAFALTLAALFACPAATAGAWLPLCALCVAVILLRPVLRLPACLVLFATAGGACYPFTGETLLPLFAGFALSGLSLCMLLGVVPGAEEKENG